MEELTAQDQEFVKEVAITGNQTKAAKKAYKIKNDGYARVKGHTQLTKPNIINAVDEVKKAIADRFDDDEVVAIHKANLNATRMDHMVFPLGPKGEDDDNLSGALPDKNPTEDKDVHLRAERTTLTDKEIVNMLAEVNCTVRRIVHGQTARHVYFWSADNMARDKALDKVYKLKGLYEANEQKSINVLMPVLVKFLNGKDDRSNNGDTQ